jgi:hypothetical protein|tara:strand:- start:107562 stop:107684 length:123 start_codon:yes stop_codon:yes gene_type:complete
MAATEGGAIENRRRLAICRCQKAVLEAVEIAIIGEFERKA